MLRTKLVIAFVGLLGPALLMGFLLYWGPRQMEQRLERTLLAHNEVQAYQALALEAYRHLQQLEYEARVAGAADQNQLSEGRQRLETMLQELRRLTLEELAFVGAAEPEEQEELERIARFRDLLEQAIAAMARAGADGSAAAVRREMVLAEFGVTQLRATFRSARLWLIIGALATLLGGVLYLGGVTQTTDAGEEKSTTATQTPGIAGQLRLPRSAPAFASLPQACLDSELEVRVFAVTVPGPTDAYEVTVLSPAECVGKMSIPAGESADVFNPST